jgi:hypothetical protein
MRCARTRWPLGAARPPRPPYGLAYRDVAFRTADGVQLSGSYIPPHYDAAVVVLPGSGSSPLEAMRKVLADHQFDEIIVATLPRRVSRWLGADLPHQAERRFGLPVTTIITSY